MNRKSAIIIDLDYTLVNANTTFDFLKFICPMRYKILSNLFRPLVLLNRIIKKDVYKIILVLLCIGGMCKEALERYAREYYLSNRNYNKRILFLLRKFHGQKILLSASLDLIVEKFKTLGFDCTIGSKMLYKKNRFYWFLDLYGRKHIIIKHLLENHHFDKLIIIDDSPEQEFYSLSGKVIILHPQRDVVKNNIKAIFKLFDHERYN